MNKTTVYIHWILTFYWITNLIISLNFYTSQCESRVHQVLVA